MEKENKFSVLNAFKGDKIVWGIVAVFSAILLTCSGYSLPMSLFYVGVGVVSTVIVAHIPHRYFKIAILPLLGVTVVFMVIGFFIAPIDGRWLSLGGIAMHPLSLTSLSVCLLLSGMAIEKDNRKRLAGVLVLVAMCACCYALEMSYAPNLMVITIFGMFLLRLYRKAVIGFVCALFVTAILSVGMVFMFGRTADERRDDSMAQNVEVSSAFQQRMDYTKERLISMMDGSASDAAKDNPALNETEEGKPGNTNILASSFHYIHKHTGGIWGCFAVILIYTSLFYRVLIRMIASSSSFAKCLAFSCVVALMFDSAYVACFAPYQHLVPTAMVQYVMFGIILSCLSSCDRTDKGRDFCTIMDKILQEK